MSIEIIKVCPLIPEARLKGGKRTRRPTVTPVDIPTDKCAQCFDNIPGDYNSAIYCSRKCAFRASSIRRKPVRQCVHCGSNLPPKRSKYCSQVCRDQVIADQTPICPLIPDLRRRSPGLAAGWQRIHHPRPKHIPYGTKVVRRSCAGGCGRRCAVPAGTASSRSFCSWCKRVREMMADHSPTIDDIGPMHGPDAPKLRPCLSCGEMMVDPKANQKRHKDCARRHNIARTMDLYQTAYSTGRVKQAMVWRRELVQYLRDRDGDRCVFCGERMDFDSGTGPKGDSDDGATIDHVVPRSLGGSNDLANLQLACWSCNRAKGNGHLAPEQLSLIG